MNPTRLLRSKTFLLTVLLAGLVLYAWRRNAQPGIGVVDPVAMARAETAMWKAYYADDKGALALNLIQTLRGQFGLSIVQAQAIAQDLAVVSLAFRRARGDYEAVALPGLERAYGRIQEATGAPFDPRAAARAELAWWVARRTPGRDSAEQAGREIARLYAVLYGSPAPGFETAGALRAQAAALRDEGGAAADWGRIEALLYESYAALKLALEETHGGNA